MATWSIKGEARFLMLVSEHNLPSYTIGMKPFDLPILLISSISYLVYGKLENETLLIESEY